MSENANRSVMRTVMVLLFLLVSNGLIVAVLLQNFFPGD